MMQWKNIRIRPLLSHMFVTLAYPVYKAVTEPGRRLLVFTDAMTIVALIILIGGVVYALILRGHFDISGFLFRRGFRRNEKQDFKSYMEDKKAKREDAFNYPLFLGLVYIAASVVLAYGFL